jgi:hypothetical protein
VIVAEIVVILWLRQYLAEERETCNLYRLPPPEETFFPEHAEKRARARIKILDRLLKFQVMRANSYAICYSVRVCMFQPNCVISAIGRLDPPVIKNWARRLL